MYKLTCYCNNTFDFLNDEHFMIWLSKYGDCYKGCCDKDGDRPCEKVKKEEKWELQY